jgi:hypothetical protein
MGQLSEAVTRVVDRTFAILKLLIFIIGGFIGLTVLSVVVAAILGALFFPTTAKDQAEAAANAQARGNYQEAARRTKTAKVLILCEQAAACKKYDAARLECATAGNLKTCLRIKMGDDDAIFTNICSGYDPGAPARPLPLETPNVVQCFFERVSSNF